MRGPLKTVVKRNVAAVAGVVFVVGCADDGFQEDVAGIARLSILQVSLLAKELSEDTRCGFDAEAVRDAVVVTGAFGERGTAVYRVEDCALGFDSIETVLDDCGAEPIRLSGRTRVTATLEIDGTITGRTNDPIIPNGPDAAKIVLEQVVLEGFTARYESRNAELVMREGSLSAVVRPRLAKGKDTAFCSVPTPDAQVTNLVYDGASLLAREEGEAVVFVSTSDLRGQIGRGERSENTYAGTLEIGGQSFEVPGRVSKALDDTYVREEFVGRFACDEDLSLPVDYACGCEGNECHPDAPVADGVARLVPLAFANVVRQIDEDERCGFGATIVPTYDAEIGAQGTATYTLSSCALQYDALEREPDCKGIATTISGGAVVSGQRSVYGYLTGDLEGDAVIPTRANAVAFTLSMQLSDFSVRTSSDTPSLLIRRGMLTGTMRPRLALDAEEGACIHATNHAAFEDVELVDADVQVIDGDDTYDLVVSRLSLDAVAGTMGDHVNTLTGTLVTASETFAIPSDGSGLDPDFDPVDFDAAFACEADLTWPTPPEACSFRQRLGPEVARAVALVLATATGRVVTDDVCGVESAAASVAATADAGQTGTVTSAVAMCTLEESSLEAVGDDCLRDKTYVGGRVTMSGTREASGRIVRRTGRTTVDPLTRDPYRDGFDATFEGYRLWTLSRDVATPRVEIEIARGSGHIDLVPIMGENEETPGVFDVPTPVGRAPRVTVADVDARLASEGRWFAVHVDSAELEVASGMYQGAGNFIRGYVVIDGERVELADGTPLDDAYDQTIFDASYACAPELLETVPPN